VEKVNIKILDAYNKRCKELGIVGTIEGLKIFNILIKEVV
jgi:hypothetical protein